jgi:hypothetical protein
MELKITDEKLNDTHTSTERKPFMQINHALFRLGYYLLAVGAFFITLDERGFIFGLGVMLFWIGAFYLMESFIPKNNFTND